jgi:DNA-binding NarL/FixJ family response regulator
MSRGSPPAEQPVDRGGTSSTPVVILEDHPVFRDALRRLVESTGEFRVSGSYATVAELRDASMPVSPSLILLDVLLPDGDGLALIKELAAKHPGLRAVVLTAYRDEWNLERARRAGAVAFLDKSADPILILETLRAAARGESRFPRGQTWAATDSSGSQDSAASTRLFQLSAREREVARLLAAGCSNQQIAATLFIAPGTAKLHVSRVYEKLGVRERSQAIVFLLAHKALL